MTEPPVKERLLSIALSLLAIVGLIAILFVLAWLAGHSDIPRVIIIEELHKP